MKRLAKGLSVVLLALPVVAGAEPVAFEQADNVTGLAGIEAGANFTFAYEKLEQNGVTLSEETLTDVPVFVRVGLPILEAKLTVPYGTIKSTAPNNDPLNPANLEETFSGIKDIGLMVKTRLLPIPFFTVAAGLDTTLPTGDPKKLLGEGFDIDPFLALDSDLLIFKLHANVGYRYRGEYSLDVTGFDPVTMQPTVEGVKLKPGDDINYAIGLEVPAGNIFSLHAELLGHSYGKVTQGGVEIQDSAGSTLSFVPGVRMHAGPLKVKVGYEIPLERKEDRPLAAPTADWRVLAGASLQFSL